MNEEQYQSLCEICDRALLAPDSTIERVAIPWLHVIREHPVFLASYVDLFESAMSPKAIGRRWLRVLRGRAAWFRQFGRALRANGHPWFGSKAFSDQIDVLFVSHLLNGSYAGKAGDFYFGELPNEIAAHGYSAVVALINYSVQPETALVEKWKESVVPRVILSSSLGILEEIALHQRLIKESSRLRRLASKEPAGLFQKMLTRASQEALSGSSQTTLRMARQIGELVVRLKPKAIIITHEGHAWERVVFAAARSADPEVRCIGYQHAMLFRLQHAIRRSLAPEYNPDQILTAGIVSKLKLERVSGLKGIPISVLGSHRSPKDTGINRGCTTNRKQAGRSDNPACLVLPEGIVSECHLLFEFSLACARACPEIQFIWRLHPLVNYKSLAARNHKLRNLPGNILLSQAMLEDDIAQSCWTLYRGTTTVSRAVIAGLRPIYLELPDELTIDPLYELDVWRTKVASVSEFQRVIYPNVGACDGPSESDLDIARRYCELHFLPSDAGALISLIPEKR